MQTITTIGLDIAKSVFQVHGVDAGGQVVVRRQLKRRQAAAAQQVMLSISAEYPLSGTQCETAISAFGGKADIHPHN